MMCVFFRDHARVLLHILINIHCTYLCLFFATEPCGTPLHAHGTAAAAATDTDAAAAPKWIITINPLIFLKCYAQLFQDDLRNANA